MATMNISLPSTLMGELDNLVKKFRFSNRSEFIRSMLRRIMADDDLLQDSVNWPFAAPKIKSRKKILSEFKKTGKYSKSFLNDLEEGLGNSQFFRE